MSAFVQAVLALVTGLLPKLADSATISNIIVTLTQLLPIVQQEIADVAPAVKNIIAALSANPAATADQLAALASLDAQVDAAFDKAAADYAAAHPAA